MIVPVVGFSQRNSFTLNAQFKTIEPIAKAYLMYNETLDSAVLSNGAFQFKGELPGPGPVRMIMDHKNLGIKKLGRNADVLSFFIDNESINLTAQDSIKTAVITGSKINTENTRYQNFISAPLKAMAAINLAYKSASEEKRKDPEYKKETASRYEKAEADKKTLQTKFIKENPDSFFSLIALYETAGNPLDVARVDSLYKGLSANLRKSFAGQEFSKLIESAKGTSIGAMAPDFTQNDVNDKAVSLSDYRGKYVLLDFWASWCVPCRAENPNVVKAYNQYKDKNFSILGISLDQPGKKDAWLGAIKADGLTWTQVSDLKFWENAVALKYGIRSIPQNFLVDPRGKIIAKNLRAEELNAKLKELFGEGASK